MDRITVDSPTGLEDVVLRRWSGEDWAGGLVRREVSALAAVSGCGVPAPHLIAMDEDGAETGVRCTLTSALTGQPDLSPPDMQSWLGQLATAQAAIHAVSDHPQTRWDGWYDDRCRPLDWLADRAGATQLARLLRGCLSRRRSGSMATTSTSIGRDRNRCNEDPRRSTAR